MRALTLIAAAIAIGVSLLFGFFAFLILAGFALILVAVVAIRLLWLRHQLRRHFQSDASPAPEDTIEGEFTVTDDERPGDRRGG